MVKNRVCSGQKHCSLQIVETDYSLTLCDYRKVLIRAYIVPHRGALVITILDWKYVQTEQKPLVRSVFRFREV